MKLQPNENRISSSDNDSVILTNFRIVGSFKELGYSHKTFISLENIASIQIVYRSSILLIVLAVISGLGGLITLYDKLEIALAAFVFALLSLIAWWVTRRRFIAIYPNGGRALEIITNSMKEKDINEFVEKVQIAKSERIKELYKLQVAY